MVTAKVIDDNNPGETIVDNFRSIYSKLYDSVEDNNLNATKSKIGNLVEYKCSNMYVIQTVTELPMI